MRALLKRFIDIAGAIVGLFLCAPLFAIVAIAVRIEDKGPVLFAQWRLGRRGEPFRCLKFRTMRMDAEDTLRRWEEQNTPQWQAYLAGNRKLRDDPRVTRIGRVLRTTSLDEIPQLINVLRGEMSLVGPRPLLSRELADYGTDALRLYEQVRPGLTGLWQVSGRSGLSMQQRATLDAQYVRQQSIALDFAILARTLPAVLRRQGAY